MNQWWEYLLNYGVLVLYFVGMVLIAVFARKRSKSTNDFLMAGRGLSGWMTAFAYGITYFSSVIFIGYAGVNGFKFGLGSLWIGLGNAVIGCLLPWLILAKRTRRLTGATGTRTMPEMFEARYGGKNLKLFSAIIIFVFLMPYAATVYQGLGYLFETVFGIDKMIIILIMAIITAVYLFFGGYFATAVSDFVQGIIMIAGVIVMLIFIYSNGSVGGLIEGFSKLTADGKGFFPEVSGADYFSLISIVLLTSLGTWGLPQMVHKFQTVRSDKGAIKKATWISASLCIIIGVGAYLSGVVARYITPEIMDSSGKLIEHADKIVPNMLIEVLPVGVIALIAVLVLSASMSTLSGLTLSSSSAVAVDLYKGYIKKDASDKQVNILMRVLCVVFIAVSVLLTLAPDSILSLMSLSWGTLAGCFIGPYIYGLFMKKASKAGVYASLISGLTINIVCYIINLAVPALKGLPWIASPAAGIYSMAVSLIIVPVVSLIFKPSKEVVEKFETVLGAAPEAEPETAAPQ